jgi:hypothetical protein
MAARELERVQDDRPKGVTFKYKDYRAEDPPRRHRQQPADPTVRDFALGVVILKLRGAQVASPVGFHGSILFNTGDAAVAALVARALSVSLPCQR